MRADGDDRFIYTPADFLGWALRTGWRPGRMPVGVIYTFQSPVCRALSEQENRFEENHDLTVSNARMFMTRDDAAPVLVACLNPGGASLATQLEHLRFLGERTCYAAIVGTAGALTSDFVIGQQVVIHSALRSDGISDRYLPPAPVVEADPAFGRALRDGIGPDPRSARAWTVPVPYRSTPDDLQAALAAGAGVVEMEVATLYAVSQALGYRAAATVVISDVSRVAGWDVEWRDPTAPLVAAVHTTIDVMRRLLMQDS